MEELKLKIAVSTGLWGIAKGEELATVVRKTGYALTRGTSAIEIAGDVPHEVDYTEGVELRYIAKKQGIDLNFHGSLTIPFEIPEMVQWREAQDHLQKSIKAAVYAGCKYVDFHACLHFWLEMLTYVGARLEIIMCDWDGEFISNILAQYPDLRKYFIDHFWEKYDRYILGEDYTPVYYKSQAEAERVTNDMLREGKITKEQFGETIGKKHTKLLKEYVTKELEEFLKKNKEWYYLGKKHGDYVDACEILANCLFFTNDPIWVDMVKMYESVMKRYNYKPYDPKDPSTFDWLWNAIKAAEEKGDTEFKEFYYGVISAKFLQGHLKHLTRWMAETKEFKGNELSLPKIIENELKMIKVPRIEEEKKELMEVLKNLKIAVESPDAREPTYAGRYMLWKNKQIYVAIKNTREALKKEGNPYWDKIFMLIDFEHIATQGVDPFEELEDLVKNVPDVSKYIVCVHSNYPSPLHSHFPIQLGDDRIYRLLWILKEAGLGKDHTTYVLFERGGFQDPFQQSVTALKLMIKFLKKNVPPDKLPEEFYGVSRGGLLSSERQWVGIFQHAMDPLKGLLKIPEEEHTFLSRAAIEAGKRPEEWKKEEYR